MLVSIPIYQIDAFTSELFGGNPAAVCPLDEWLPDDILQRIAAENNLSETAFFVKTTDSYHLRWFTPTTELALCGHATLASGVVVAEELGDRRAELIFHTQSGPLYVRRDGEYYQLDFPAQPAELCDAPDELISGLGLPPVEVRAAEDFLAIYASQQDIETLKPDFEQLMGLPHRGVITTAPGDEVDFVSRWFGPSVGVPEDPVTGSAHTTLTPYWADRLGKRQLMARQVSKRGGEIRCTLQGDRVLLSGKAVKYLEGKIFVPGE